MKKKITQKTLIGEAVRINPGAAIIFMKHGMGCAVCPMSASETIESGAAAHGISKKQVSKLIKELNG